MILRSLYQDELPALTKVMPTVLVSWWVTGVTLAVIFMRLSGRLIRTNQLFREDWIMLSSVVPLCIRMALVHLVLIWGTNNLGTDGFTDITSDREHQVLGSKMVLASRIFFAAFIWLQKLTITEFFERLTSQFWRTGYVYGLYIVRYFLLASFIGIVISTIAECQPIANYWQVDPLPPPQCREAYGQLIAMGAFDIITDIILIILPVHIILTSGFPTKRKFQLTLLFGLSILPIICTGYRIPKIIELHGRQQFRSLWASLEILAATTVANALVLGSFVRDRGIKKAKYRVGSASDSLDRTPTRRRRPSHWGSDEDLVHDLGICLEPSLRHYDDLPDVRPAPMAVEMDHSKGTASAPRSLNPRANDFQFADNDDDEAESSSDLSLKALAQAQTEAEAEPRSPGQVSVATAGKMSFFDVGGLLEEGMPRRESSTANTTLVGSTNGVHSTSSAQDMRHPSTSSTTDIGVLAAPPPAPQPAEASGTGRPSGQVPAQVTGFNQSRSANRVLHEALAEEPPPHMAVHQEQQINEDEQRVAESRNRSSRKKKAQGLQDVGGLLGD